MESTILAAIVAGACTLLGVALTARVQLRAQINEQRFRAESDSMRQRGALHEQQSAAALARLEQAHRLLCVIERDCSLTGLNIKWTSGMTPAEYDQRYLALCAEADTLRAIADFHEPSLIEGVNALYGQMNMFWGNFKNMLDMTAQGKSIDHMTPCHEEAHKAARKISELAIRLKFMLRTCSEAHHERAFSVVER